MENVEPEHISSLIWKLRDAGCRLEIGRKDITLECVGRPKSVRIIDTQPYPGFPTDLQAQAAALQSVSDGACILYENIFESRFKYVPELVKMGADITVRDRAAFIQGVKALSGAALSAHDLRGGAALTLAGLCARGTTTIGNIGFIDRGYYEFEKKLRALGAEIYRE